MTTSTLPTHYDDATLDRTFAALANGTRRALLAKLAEGAANVNDLAEPFNMSLPAISKHLKVLESAGLVSRSKHAQYRPCALEPEALALVADWAEQYRHIWDSRFDQMDEYLDSLNDESTLTKSSNTKQAGNKDGGKKKP